MSGFKTYSNGLVVEAEATSVVTGIDSSGKPTREEVRRVVTNPFKEGDVVRISGGRASWIVDLVSNSFVSVRTEVRGRPVTRTFAYEEISELTRWSE